MVEILMVYVSGVQKMLDVTLKSFARHDAGYPYRLKIVTDVRDIRASNEVFQLEGYDIRASYDVGVAASSSGQHSRLLDEAAKDTTDELLLSMDSDCFPVADGWLKKLVDMQTPSVATSGVLWPWCPPAADMNPKTIEWKIRRQHCWNNTQVACQLIHTKLMRDMGWKFGDPEGDDTGFGLMDKAHIAGMQVVGLMPTRCPLPDVGITDFDPEYNRFESIIFGDMIYHHVGATRENCGEVKGKEAIFTASRKRVIDEEGAEWMLQPGNSHVFKMDQEESVAQFKMQMLLRSAVWFLEKNNTLFGGGWV